MRKFKVEVNGNIYEVEVEEIGGTTGQPQQSQAQPAASPPSPSPAAPKKPEAKSPGEAEMEDGVLKSPMQGTIVDILVSPGDEVSEGDVVLILEAMKMENEIHAPRSGVVRDIAVAKGDAVTPDDVLATIE